MKKIRLKDGKNTISAVVYEPRNNKTSTIVVCAHGMGSNKSSVTYREFTKAMNRLGIATLAFDFYGHGESSGKIEDITISKGVSNVLTAVGYAKKLGYRNVGLLGGSFGGICSIMAASKTRISFLMLKAPVSNYTEVIARKKIDTRKWKNDSRIIYEPAKRIKYGFYTDFKNNDGYKAARKIKIPAIIVHGNRDEIVPIEQSKKISGIMKDCRLVVLKNTGHIFTGPQTKKAVSIFSDFTAEVSKRI